MTASIAHRFTTLRASVACVIAFATTSAAVAQDNSTPPAAVIGEQSATIETASGKKWRFTFGGGYTHTFETDLDDGDGNVSTDAISGGFNASTDFTDDLRLAFRVNFGATDYAFGGPTGFGSIDGGDGPWDTVHNLAFGAVANYTFDDKWAVYGGPIMEFNRESGADWDDSATYGAIAGVTYFASEDLVLGMGVGVKSQIEDDAQFFPIPVVEWRINDNFRVSTVGLSGGRTNIVFSNIELICMTDSKAWEFALGAGLAKSRFRLDDDGVAPDGVGTDESTPIWLRVSFRPNPTFMIDAIAGIGFGGELELENSDGDRIADSDYDNALILGLFGSIKF